MPGLMEPVLCRKTLQLRIKNYELRIERKDMICLVFSSSQFVIRNF